MVKTPKADVRYRPADDVARSCTTCWKFRGSKFSAGYCLKIAGDIYPDDTCDRWEAKRTQKRHVHHQLAGMPTEGENIDQAPNEPVRWNKVRVYVFNPKGELLGLRRNVGRHRAGLWEMVQGTMDDGESPEDAAKREFREETGYALSVVEDWVQVGDHTWSASLLPGAGDPDVTTNPESPLEHDAYEWQRPDVMLGWFGRRELAKAAVEDIERILRAVAWDDWDGLTRLIAPGLSEAAGEGVLQGFQELDLQDDEAFSLANADAIDYASTRATLLIDQLAQTTRQGLRDLIEQALVDGQPVEQLTDAIVGAGLFSADRAERIARTELAIANTQGNLIAWRRSGVVHGKKWLMSNMHDQDDECDENAQAGVIPLDEAFPSGDDGPPAHPNCNCVVVPITTSVEAAA